MYWYKSKIYTLILCGGLFAVAVLPSCKPDIKETGAQLKYFDLDGFMRKDSVRLSKLNPLIYKTVMHDKDTESRRVHIANWGAELSLFEQSDINKPAWRDQYTVQTGDGVTVYKAKDYKDPKLKTRELSFKEVNGKVVWILIRNHTKNFLYETDEYLNYFPDSLYIIEKKQSVKFLGANKYWIKGLFINDVPKPKPSAASKTR